MLLALIAGVPVEEFLPAVPGVGTVVVLARTWARERTRRKGGAKS